MINADASGGLTVLREDLAIGLRAKLDAGGYYDEFEIERVVGDGAQDRRRVGRPRRESGRELHIGDCK